MATTEADSDGASPDVEPEASDVERLVPWHRTTTGGAVVLLDALLALLVVVGTTEIATPVLEAIGAPSAGLEPVDPAIYLFAMLGALGYVFTALVREPDRPTRKLIHYNVRMFAALPLAAGVYLFSDLILGTNPPDALVAGLAFVAGLYVNLTYERIGMLAERLLPE